MVLVTGATGTIGRHLVEQLTRLGRPFRPLSGTRRGPRPRGGRGDLDDPASLAAALRGADQSLLNSGGAVPVEGERPTVRQWRAAIEAARTAGVSRVVRISACSGSTPIWPPERPPR
ncbi:NAD-dependent epimerase/dehydratase family protein [Streptomyces sp. AJS327]|uniref:SDR family oxidoreductase n=1 Tax=Streptomyces sp. AJS327 TaxID=2545265 RepID=UPI0015DF30F8|nr:NAD(P)H-binding protein [Streptomyces sp. AJS327]MBA0050677.1 NAD-dependent epimerase/dehydratase family protein [Streptomyces sp. AJS327]